jgi:WD40 repeat protein
LIKIFTSASSLRLIPTNTRYDILRSSNDLFYYDENNMVSAYMDTYNIIKNNKTHICERHIYSRCGYNRYGDFIEIGSDRINTYIFNISDDSKRNILETPPGKINFNILDMKLIFPKDRDEIYLYYVDRELYIYNYCGRYIKTVTMPPGLYGLSAVTTCIDISPNSKRLAILSKSFSKSEMYIISICCTETGCLINQIFITDVYNAYSIIYNNYGYILINSKGACAPLKAIKDDGTAIYNVAIPFNINTKRKIYMVLWNDVLYLCN